MESEEDLDLLGGSLTVLWNYCTHLAGIDVVCEVIDRRKADENQKKDGRKSESSRSTRDGMWGDGQVNAGKLLKFAGVMRDLRGALTSSNHSRFGLFSSKRRLVNKLQQRC